MAQGRDLEGLFSVQEKFNDFDIAFTRNPVTGDLVTLSTDESIKQAVRLLVMTQYYERAYRPYLGTKIAGMLFELADPVILSSIEQDLTKYINRYEPRVVVQSIDVSSVNELDANTITVYVRYIIKGSTKAYEQTILIKRLR